MKIRVLTLFPDMFAPLKASVIGRAAAAGLLDIGIVDIRAFSGSKHKKCDDYPFGGGAGMVMTPQPIYSAVTQTDPEHKALRVYMSPKGKVLHHNAAVELSRVPELLILCGHYEGVDQRALDMLFDIELSIGDYVLTGGELPAMVLVDAVARHIPGVLGELSTEEESFCGGLLEYPQYTRPADFMGLKTPEVLLSGDHGEVAAYRKREAERLTRKNRPDLYRKYKKQTTNDR
ncbi:MAG: tRNA (guanosine(37)-N1)-methyltransferase TrmD [Firmicutes bacterium]|nr:tRNA (guanosine(37)-N1)-methyltransferase TrmD [Bacillota bacterium]